jgi:sigma-B regulation protein RsbU (phosphoserine phosphatase)
MIANIQRSFLPKRPIARNGIEAAHAWVPLEEIGGDFLYYGFNEDASFSMEIGDVLGHGTRAGLVMAALHGLIYGLRGVNAPVNHGVARANSFLCALPLPRVAEEPPKDQPFMASFFALRIDLKRRTLSWCNAGHPPPLYLGGGSDDPRVLPLSTGGLVLGVLGETQYQLGTLRPDPGDVLLLFTDGLTEARDAEGREFGDMCDLSAQLPRWRGRSAKECVMATQDLLSKHTSLPLSDDLCITVLRFTEKW